MPKCSSAARIVEKALNQQPSSAERQEWRAEQMKRGAEQQLGAEDVPGEAKLRVQPFRRVLQSELLRLVR
jgi:hypothetical protein